MAPISEIGHGVGRHYGDAVHVVALSDGTVRVTEHNGHQSIVSLDGKVKNPLNHLKHGVYHGHLNEKKSENVKEIGVGHENVYYGRGYVQLTWWDNYAKSGVAIGRGLSLLLNPESVENPEIAYAIMSDGMRTGRGFAHKRTFDNFFSGDKKDYAGARDMVNPKDIDSKDKIAAYAQKFEDILMKCRILNSSKSAH